MTIPNAICSPVYYSATAGPLFSFSCPLAASFYHDPVAPVVLSVHGPAQGNRMRWPGLLTGTKTLELPRTCLGTLRSRRGNSDRPETPSVDPHEGSCVNL